MMAAATKKTKPAKTSTSAKPKPDATSTERLRKAVLKEITDRIAKGETSGSTDAINHSEQGAPPVTSPTAPKTPKPKKGTPPREPKPKAEKAPKPAKEKKPKRVSALDAAATVLADTRKPMRAIDLIAEIQQRGLWSSPNGKTPEASLYAAMIREITAKGKDARFTKHDKGLFITNTTAKANTPASA